LHGVIINWEFQHVRDPDGKVLWLILRAEFAKGIFLFFAVAGVFLVAAKLVSFVRVLLSLFILPGVSV
jgi:hypothetical protein